jgi:voltage-gated potassium channel
MAVITVSTVGYGEVRPLSAGGRALTVVVIVFAVAALGYSATAIGAYLAEGHLLQDFRRRRMERAIRRLRDHYIICGGGRFGREVAEEFSRSRAAYAVVDLAPGECEIAGFKDAVFVQGDAGNDEALQAAGVDRARGLVSALPADDANLFVVLTARQLNPELTIITQATEQRSIEKLRLAGANRVVSPYRIAGHSMASALLRPTVVDFIDVAHRERTGLQIEEVLVPEHSPLIGNSIRGAGVSEATGATVMAIQRSDGEWVNASESATLATTPIQARNVLIAVGTDQQLRALRRLVD